MGPLMDRTFLALSHPHPNLEAPPQLALEQESLARLRAHVPLEVDPNIEVPARARDPPAHGLVKVKLDAPRPAPDPERAHVRVPPLDARRALRGVEAVAGDVRRGAEVLVSVGGGRCVCQHCEPRVVGRMCTHRLGYVLSGVT